jgi:hypothetical protein
MFQRIVGVRIGGYDALGSRGLDGVHIVIAQRHEQRLFAESAGLMPAVFFRRAQDPEIHSGRGENSRGSAPDRLHAVVVGSDTVHEVQRIRATLGVRGLDGARLRELFGLGPLSPFLLHLAVGIAAALEGLQRFLQRLGYVAVVDHAPPQIDNLVDVLDQQRAFFFTGTTGRTRPDFVFGINAAGRN